MSTVRHVNGDGSHLAPSVMSVNRIQQRELFDDDDDDDDNRASAARAAGDNDNDDVTDDDVCILSSPAHSSSTSRCCVDNSFRNIVTMALLTLVNLLNYMDRFSVAGTFWPFFSYRVHIGVARWLSGRASDLRSKSRGFEARPRRCCATTLGKLFTPYCLCHLSPSSIIWYQLKLGSKQA